MNVNLDGLRVPCRAAVLGSPITHSLSPLLHRAAYAALGLDWFYEAVEVTKPQLGEFIAGLDDSWAGLSLTMPLKETVIDLLVEIDPVARMTGAVNTVLPYGSGWRGMNTDVFGMVEALCEKGLSIPVESVLILGAGATARSAVAAAAQLGCTMLTVCARNTSAAHAVLDVASNFGIRADAKAWLASELISDFDLVISTVPGDIASPWVEFALEARGALLDVSYHPWPSPLARNWPGSVIASGRDMLLWQAVEQVHLMTGRPAPAAAMRAALPEN